MHKARIILSDTESLATLGFFILATFTLASAVRWLMRRRIERKLAAAEADLTVYKFIRDLVTLTIYLVGIGWALLTLPISATYAHTLLVSAGASTLIIGFASQQVLGNIISGIYLVMRRSYRLNDIIEINGSKGKVVEINIHETVLTSMDGKQRITIPNTLVSTAIIIHHQQAATRGTGPS
ncbi:MAG: mechanosensitive ion channel family protein [Flavobacteriales bacterium]|nr:mechanosensitive ion channel family protein [Flavobacteriales bacterium]HRN38107.1 mechanosensitive ion channel [Flavobacteriales bacterium]HRO40578.1 mechanosensitive ion channel [Flavobacteriales bacterium]HRP82991.1 mechanosensitive ion channel [Flavobacteriales bacterium]